VNITSGIFPTAVIDVAMALVRSRDMAIGVILVGHQISLGAHKGVYHGFEYADTLTVHRGGSNRSATLNGDQHSLL